MATTQFVMAAAKGALMGVLYQGAVWYNTEHYPVNHLNPKPEAFFVDTKAFHIFACLSRYRKYNAVAYIAALHNTDSLLKLEDVLSKWAAKGHDLTRAETYHKMTLSSAKKLYKSYLEEEKKAKDSEFEDLVANLEGLVDVHLQNITTLCSS